MMNHLKEDNRRYVTMDDMRARHLAETDPMLFFETYGSRLIIDEFQRIPSILLEIKRIVDMKALAGEDNAGMFWLTGSQKFQMMHHVSESLAGRVAVLEMSGFSSAELENRPLIPFHPGIEQLKERLTHCIPRNIHAVYENIFRGGMPKKPTAEKTDCRKQKRIKYFLQNNPFSCICAACQRETSLILDVWGYSSVGRAHDRQS